MKPTDRPGELKRCRHGVAIPDCYTCYPNDKPTTAPAREPQTCADWKEAFEQMHQRFHNSLADTAAVLRERDAFAAQVEDWKERHEIVTDTLKIARMTIGELQRQREERSLERDRYRAALERILEVTHGLHDEDVIARAALEQKGEG